jgi:hypothetical protein
MSNLRSLGTDNAVYPAEGGSVEPEERIWRLSLAAVTAAAVGVVLLWCSLLVLGLGIGGKDVCTDYVYSTNPHLFDWCQGNSWHGWTSSWGIAAFLIIGGARVLARRRRRLWPLYAAIPLACAAFWIGLVVPQIILA